MDNSEAQYEKAMRQENAMRELTRSQGAMNANWQTGQEHLGQANMRNYFADPPQYRNTKGKAREPWVTIDRLYMASLTVIVVLHLIRDAGLL